MIIDGMYIPSEMIAMFKNMASGLDNNLNEDWKESVDVEKNMHNFKRMSSNLELAIKQKNKASIRENISNCGKILLLLGNSFELY